MSKSGVVTQKLVSIKNKNAVIVLSRRKNTYEVYVDDEMSRKLDYGKIQEAIATDNVDVDIAFGNNGPYLVGINLPGMSDPFAEKVKLVEHSVGGTERCPFCASSRKVYAPEKSYECIDCGSVYPQAVGVV